MKSPIARVLVLLCAIAALFSDAACNCGDYPAQAPNLDANAFNLRLARNALLFVQRNLESVLRANFPVDPTGQYITIYLPEAQDSSANTLCNEDHRWPVTAKDCTYGVRLRDGCIGPGQQDASGKCQPDLGIARETMRSYITLKVADLAANLTIDMEGPGAIDTGAIHLRLSNMPIDASLALYLNFTELLPANIPIKGDVACLFSKGPGADHALMINDLDISVIPTIEDVGGTPELFATSVVHSLSLSALSLNATALSTDPACGDKSPISCADACSVAGDVLTYGSQAFNVIDNFIAPVMPYIATPLANVALALLWGKPVAFTAGVPAGAQPYIPKAVGRTLSITANLSPGAFAVTQANPGQPDDPTMGMNVPVAMGASADPSPCVGPVDAPVFAASPPPTLTGTISLPDPDFPGFSYDANYELGATLSQAFINQALFAARNSGLFCINAGSNPGGLLSTGSFVPTAALLYLLAPPLQRLGPNDAPIYLQMTPGRSQLTIGSNQVTGTDSTGHPIVDPLLRLDLYDVDIEFQLFSFERFVRVFGLKVDLSVGLSLATAKNGHLIVTIDSIKASNLKAVFNPFMPNFDFSNLTEVIFQVLASQISGNNLTFDLPISDSIQKALGSAPVTARVLDVRQDGVNRDYLSVFIKLCAANDLTDPTNKACRTTPAQSRFAILAASAGLSATDKAEIKALRAESEPNGHLLLDVSADDLEYQISVDGGAFGSFGAAHHGQLDSYQPLLKILGHHQVTVRARQLGTPVDLESETTTVDVLVDPEHPAVKLDGLHVSSDDLVTSPDKMRFLLNGDGPWLNLVEINQAAESAPMGSTIVAVDEAGNQSEPACLGGACTLTPAAKTGRGCTNTTADAFPSLFAGLALIIFYRRRA